MSDIIIFYIYSLNSGNVIGGSYHEWDRTDFAWMTDINAFHGYNV